MAVWCKRVAAAVGAWLLVLASSSAPVGRAVVNADGSVVFTVTGVAEGCAVVVEGTCFSSQGLFSTSSEVDGEVHSRRLRWEGDHYSYTSRPLVGGMYVYRFLVDDVPFLDASSTSCCRDIDKTYNYFIIPGGVGDYLCSRAIPHGAITKVWYPSTMKGWQRRRMTIYTPPDYAVSGRRYPVLYLLHGSGGDENAWLEMGRLPQIMDAMLSSHACREMIVVMPNGNVAMDRAAVEDGVEYYPPSASNVKSMLGEMERTFVTDIVTYVDGHYRTLADSAHRAIAGLSLGGLHTLFIALNNPTTFGYIGLFSAQTTNGLDKGMSEEIASLQATFSSLRSLFRGEGENGTTDDSSAIAIYSDEEAKMAALFAANPRLFYITVGADDFTKPLNRQLKKQLDKHSYPYTYRETPGRHTWDTWRGALIDYLPLLF